MITGQRSPRTQISKEDKKAQEQEERITQSILGSRIEPPSETPRETVAQLESDISNKYRHVVKINQEPQSQRVKDRVKYKKDQIKRNADRANNSEINRTEINKNKAEVFRVEPDKEKCDETINRMWANEKGEERQRKPQKEQLDKLEKQQKKLSENFQRQTGEYLKALQQQEKEYRKYKRDNTESNLPRKQKNDKALQKNKLDSERPHPMKIARAMNENYFQEKLEKVLREEQKAPQRNKLDLEKPYPKEKFRTMQEKARKNQYEESMKRREAKSATGNYFQEKVEKTIREEEESYTEEEESYTEYESQAEEQCQVCQTEEHTDREERPRTQVQQQLPCETKVEEGLRYIVTSEQG